LESQLSKLEVEKSITNNTIGQAGFLPVIDISLVEQLTVSRRDNPTSFVNGVFNSSNFIPTITLNQTIFNGFTARISKKNLESLEKISQNNVNLVLLNHTKALYSLFWQYQAQQEFITYQQKNLAITKSLYEYNKSKWDLGTITTQELNTYLSFVYEDSLSLLQLELQSKEILNNIQKVVGAEDFLLKKNIDRLSLEPLIEKESLYSLLEKNPNLIQSVINEEIKNQELGLSKSSLYPRLTVGIGSSYNASFFQNETIGSGRGTTSELYANFSLTYNLFNGFKTKNGIKIAKYNTEVSQIQTQKLQTESKLDLDKYITGYENNLEQLYLSEQLSDLTEQTLNYWLLKEQAGIITSIELRDFQKNVLLNKRNELNYWLNAYLSFLEIQTITSSLVSQQ